MSPLQREAREVALEQVLHWRSFMTAREAAKAIGIHDGDRSWAGVGERLAAMWLELRNIELKRAA